MGLDRREIFPPKRKWCQLVPIATQEITPSHFISNWHAYFFFPYHSLSIFVFPFFFLYISSSHPLKPFVFSTFLADGLALHLFSGTVKDILFSAWSSSLIGWSFLLRRSLRRLILWRSKNPCLLSCCGSCHTYHYVNIKKNSDYDFSYNYSPYTDWNVFTAAMATISSLLQWWVSYC